MPGIVSIGGYIPRLRLQRAAIVAANAWANSSLKAHGKGERAICNWDEDSLTMAVEAARDCVGEDERAAIAAVHLASTTLPFADRQNAVVIAEALNLAQEVGTLDITSSQRAATSGLIAAFDALATDDARRILLVAAEHRRVRSGAVEELLYGDGAAALLLGGGDGMARLVATHSVATDFVDHYRGQGAAFDYGWEERWVRDEGYMKIVPGAVAAVLAKAGIGAEAIDRFVMPCALRRVTAGLAKRIGIGDHAIADTLAAVCGDTGAAHPIVMLVHALEHAAPGERILAVGFGQGCDALLFEVTEEIARPRAVGAGIAGALERRRAEDNYNKFLAFNDLVEKDYGKRAEADRQTYLSAFYRNRRMITGFVGGECTACGTVQFPKAPYCVNPNCRALDSQHDRPMADRPGTVVTWSADYLTFTIDPPAYYGMVQFDGGGRLLADFTDVDREALAVGARVRFRFRIKAVDGRRGFKRYFWKGVPESDAARPSHPEG